MVRTTYVERAPVAALAGRVRAVWQMRVPDDASHTQRVLPDGCADVLWWGGKLSVAGPDTAYRMVDLVPGTTITAIRFRTGAAGVLFGDVPVSEARDDQPPLAGLWGDGAARELTERLADAASPADVLETAVAARLSQVDDVDPVVVRAVSLFDSPAPPSVSGVADRFGLSERQFRRRFVHAVGYGPSTLVGVLRLERAMRLFGTSERTADVAAVAGYADQPHMTRELRKLAGVTPGRLRR